MWKEGLPYEKMAKAINRYHAKADDPTKHIRAIVSTMLTRGYKNEQGKVVRLQPRKQMRNIGAGRKVHSKKVIVKKVVAA